MSGVLVLTTAALGALAGALAPRPAYRLSVELDVPPRSACATCAVPFPAGPRGWLRLGDRCPACGATLGPYAWLTVPTGALVCGVLGWAVDPTATPAGGTASTGAPGGRAAAAAFLVLTAFLLVGAVGVLLGAIDLRCLRLPNLLVRPATLLVLLLLGAATAVSGSAGAVHDLSRALAGAVALAGGYLLLALVPGARLGLGDVKLCALLGLLLGWLGWGAVLLGALLPHLINGPVSLGLLLAGRAGRKTELPLGPALLAGCLLAIAAHALVNRSGNP